MTCLPQIMLIYWKYFCEVLASNVCSCFHKCLLFLMYWGWGGEGCQMGNVFFFLVGNTHLYHHPSGIFSLLLATKIQALWSPLIKSECSGPGNLENEVAVWRTRGFLTNSVTSAGNHVGIIPFSDFVCVCFAFHTFHVKLRGKASAIEKKKSKTNNNNNINSVWQIFKRLVPCFCHASVARLRCWMWKHKQLV